MGTGIERIVLDFVHAAYGEHMDVEAMTALMAEDFIWQLNVPLSPIIRGRERLLRSGMSSIGSAMTRSEVVGRGAEVAGLVEQVIPVLNLPK